MSDRSGTTLSGAGRGACVRAWVSGVDGGGEGELGDLVAQVADLLELPGDGLAEPGVGLAEPFLLAGAYALGPEAGEWLQQATLAIRHLPLVALRDVIPPFPTCSQVYVAV